jgi:hypothetical protein
MWAIPQRGEALLAVPGTAADARKATLAAWDAAGACVLASEAATHTGKTALAARTAARAAVLASRTAVAVVVAAASTWVVHEDDVCRRHGGFSRASRESVSCSNRCNCSHCCNSPGHHQWFHEIPFH